MTRIRSQTKPPTRSRVRLASVLFAGVLGCVACPGPRPDVAARPSGDAGQPDQGSAAERTAHDAATRRFAEGDYEGALTILDAALASAPRSAQLQTARGDALLQLFEFDSALAAYEAAIVNIVASDDPTTSWAAWHGKGLALLRLGRRSEAEQALRTALRWKPSAQTHFFLANALAESGDVEAGIRELDRAVALAPDYGNAYGTRALYRAKLGDVEGAVADYLQVKQHSPHLLPIVEMGLRKYEIELPK
jgi:tetratricopeptide (TPR) repeat protein